jgi:hypothetical protein
MNSSHSGTPIFSPAVLAVLAGVEVGLLVVAPSLVGVELFVSGLVQPTKKRVHTIPRDRESLFNIRYSFDFGQQVYPEPIETGLKSVGIIHEAWCLWRFYHALGEQAARAPAK